MAEEKKKPSKSAETPDANEILSKHLGSTHYVADKIYTRFHELNDIVHYYLDKFGPYLPPEMRKDLAILALRADRIAAEINDLMYNIEILRAEAKAYADRGEAQGFSMSEEEVSGVERAVKRVEKMVDEFAAEFREFIDSLLDTVKRTGIE